MPPPLDTPAPSHPDHMRPLPWSGVYADDVDIAWPDTELSATELAERLGRFAGQLDDAVGAAAAENRRRADLRAQYDCARAHPNIPC